MWPSRPSVPTSGQNHCLVTYLEHPTTRLHRSGCRLATFRVFPYRVADERRRFVCGPQFWTLGEARELGAAHETLSSRPGVGLEVNDREKVHLATAGEVPSASAPLQSVLAASLQGQDHALAVSWRKRTTVT